MKARTEAVQPVDWAPAARNGGGVGTQRVHANLDKRFNEMGTLLVEAGNNVAPIVFRLAPEKRMDKGKVRAPFLNCELRCDVRAVVGRGVSCERVRAGRL